MSSSRKIKRNGMKKREKQMKRLVKDAKRMGLQVLPMVPKAEVRREEPAIPDLDWEEEEA